MVQQSLLILILSGSFEIGSYCDWGEVKKFIREKIEEKKKQYANLKWYVKLVLIAFLLN
jgi:hypothetical protein